MKLVQLSILFLTTCISVAVAQNATQSLPACAVQCMELHLPQSSCSTTDQLCICENQEFYTAVAACVSINCSAREGLTTHNITAQTCRWPIHNKQSLVQQITVPFLTIATLFFIARITARLPVFGGEFGPDDYMICVTYAFALSFTVILLIAASAGLGKDIWQVPFAATDDQITYTLKLFGALVKTYVLTVWATKISILLLYLRIFPDSGFRTKVKLCIAFCAATGFCLFFACLFNCWPISYGWTYWDGDHHGHCSDLSVQGWAGAGLNIVGDLVVLALPLPTIWRMPLTIGRRVGVIIMFSVGIFITMISMARLTSLRVFNYSTNPTRDFVSVSLWSLLEIHVGMICACLPGARNFYSRIVCGRIFHKGQFAPGASRSDSPSFLLRQMSERSQPGCNRITSTASSITSTSQNISISKEFIIIINDTGVEESGSSPISYDRTWHIAGCDVEKQSVPEQCSQ